MRVVGLQYLLGTCGLAFVLGVSLSIPGISGCFAPPDVKGLRCESEKDCFGVACLDGFCGGRIDDKAEPIESIEEVGKEPVTHDAAEPIQEAKPESSIVPERPIEKTPDVPHCPAGQSICESACVDLKKDKLHCGQCNQPCSAGQICAEGKCLGPFDYHSCDPVNPLFQCKDLNLYNCSKVSPGGVNPDTRCLRKCRSEKDCPTGYTCSNISANEPTVCFRQCKTPATAEQEREQCKDLKDSTLSCSPSEKCFSFKCTKEGDMCNMSENYKCVDYSTPGSNSPVLRCLRTCRNNLDCPGEKHLCLCPPGNPNCTGPKYCFLSCEKREDCAKDSWRGECSQVSSYKICLTPP